MPQRAFGSLKKPNSCIFISLKQIGAQHIQQVSAEALKIGEGSLYPALQRLLLNDFVKARWGVTENNRRARYYEITAAGRKHLESEKRKFDFVLAGIARVMEA